MNETVEPANVITDDQTDRLLAAACHLGTFVIWLAFANIIIPLVIWVIKKDKSPLINDQGKEALNFQITIIIAYVVSIVLMFVFIGFLLALVVFIYHIVYSIIAAMKAYEGKAYRYPFAIRLIA